jgi:hypothetical protein
MMKSCQLRLGLLGTELFEGFYQVRRDRSGVPALDLVTLHHVHELAIPQYTDARRGGLVSLEIGSRRGRGLAVLPGEYRDTPVRQLRMPHHATDRRTHLPRSAAAHGIHDHHDRARRRNRFLDVGSGTGFCEPKAGQFFAEGCNHRFWIHITIISPDRTTRSQSFYGIY